MCKKAPILIGVLLCFITVQARDSHLKRSTKVFGGLGAGIYAPSTKHARAFQSRGAFTAGFMQEYRVGRGYQSYFSFGVQYAAQFITYQSYYFAPGTLQLYDRSMLYDYRLLLHEMQLPLQYKLLLKREDNTIFSPYCAAGYFLRFFLPANVWVTKEGASVIKDQPTPEFTSPLGIKTLNAAASVAIGLQQNKGKKAGAFFVEIQYKTGFSSFSFRADYAANSVFLRDSQLLLILGLRF